MSELQSSEDSLPTFHGAAEFASLGQEGRTDSAQLESRRKEPGHEDYRATLDSVLEARDGYVPKPHESLREQRSEISRFMNERQEDARLELFGQIMIDAPRQVERMAILASLNKLSYADDPNRQSIAKERLDRDQIDTETDEYTKSIRDLIIGSNGAFDRETFVGWWQEAADKGDLDRIQPVIEPLIDDAVVQVGLRDALRLAEGVGEVEFTTERDGQKSSVTAVYTGNGRPETVAFAAGIDRQRPSEIRHLGTSETWYGEIGVPRSGVEGFKITDDSQAGMQAEVESLLHSTIAASRERGIF